MVIVESRSPKSFVVGANLAVLKAQDETNIGDWVKNGHRIFNQLQHLPQPVIAKVAKNALGGGLELAMACDFIIAGENARFGHPEAGLGVMPGWGGSYRLRMLVGPARAKEMIFTAQPIDAATACAWGLVNRVCKEEELDGAVRGAEGAETLAVIRKETARMGKIISQLLMLTRGYEGRCHIEKEDLDLRRRWTR